MILALFFLDSVDRAHNMFERAPSEGLLCTYAQGIFGFFEFGT